jgi:hypothetical protein
MELPECIRALAKWNNKSETGTKGFFAGGNAGFYAFCHGFAGFPSWNA